MPRQWGYLCVYIFPFLVWAGYALGGLGHWLTPVFTFVGIPILDLLVGPDNTNPDPADYQKLQHDRTFRVITLAFVPVQVLGLAWALQVAASGQLSGHAWWGFLCSVGVVCGAGGINLAHELGHRRTLLETTAAKTLLATVCYLHFYIEHNKGHHAKVSTPQDPASARLGESFFRYLPRTLFGGYFSAWDIETRRLKKKGLRIISIHNQMLWFSLIPIALGMAIFWRLGPLATGFFYGQAFVAVLLLELTNYIEHYGLERKKNANGRYEKVTPLHSWNANPAVSNRFLFELQRHADHHANPTRGYPNLRHIEDSPQLPFGYATLIPLALVPPLWRRVMDPRVQQIRNLHPSATPGLAQ